MFVPLYDFNRLDRIRFQYVTVALIIANCVIFLMQMGGVSIDLQMAMTVVPSSLLKTGATEAGGIHLGVFTLEKPWTLLTYMFLHGSWLHLGGNMLFLWVFGDNVEDALGHVRFFIFYILCGVIAGIVHVTATHALMPPGSPGLDAPMLGASGAVAGVIAAYLMLHPRVRVWVLVMFRIPLRVSAGFALLVWVGLQVVSAYLAYEQKDYGGTAWWAHIGGLMAGAILVIFMRRSDVELFDRATGLEPKPSIFNPPPQR